MKIQIQLCAHHTIAELKQAIKNSKDELQKTRLRAIINIKNGETRTKVSKQYVVTQNTVRSWIKAYNTGGTPALIFNKGGRPYGNHKWNQTMFDELVKEIDKGGKCWSIPVMQEWIEDHYKKDVPESTVWYHLKRLDYSYKSSRPHPYKGDRKKQKSFKKRG